MPSTGPPICAPRPRRASSEVGVIGFSHGGWAVLKAVLAGLVHRPNEPPFAAAVAFYPGCDPRDPPGRPLETDTLITLASARPRAVR